MLGCSHIVMGGLVRDEEDTADPLGKQRLIN